MHDNLVDTLTYPPTWLVYGGGEVVATATTDAPPSKPNHDC